MHDCAGLESHRGKKKNVKVSMKKKGEVSKKEEMCSGLPDRACSKKKKKKRNTFSGCRDALCSLPPRTTDPEKREGG